MNTSQLLIYPMAFYVFYVAGLFVYTFICRTRGTLAGEFSALYYKDYKNKQEVPRKYLMMERHMDHQFQLPTVFLVSGVVHLAMNTVTMFTVYLAWGFVASRFGHSFIHLGRNKILQRAAIYAVGGLMILLMWVQLLVSF